MTDHTPSGSGNTTPPLKRATLWSGLVSAIVMTSVAIVTLLEMDSDTTLSLFLSLCVTQISDLLGSGTVVGCVLIVDWLAPKIPSFV
jgi:hypothetical protein